MRTHEQVVADVEKRFNELKEEKRLHDIEMAKPKYTKPCETCRYAVRPNKYSSMLSCTNPLVKGLGEDVQLKSSSSVSIRGTKKLVICKGATYYTHTARMGGHKELRELNDEQALWEPRLTRFQKFINLFNKGE